MILELPGRCVQLIGEGQFIAPSATLIGAVTLHSEVSIWFQAVLRADDGPIVVGEGSNIQDGSIVHTDPGLEVRIGASVTIGHGAIIHGCTVEDGSLVGMGSTLLNGVVIGRRCLIGANSLLTEGTHIPDGHLAFGSPARVRRLCTADELAVLATSASSYRKRCQLYASTIHVSP